MLCISRNSARINKMSAINRVRGVGEVYVQPVAPVQPAKPVSRDKTNYEKYLNGVVKRGGRGSLRHVDVIIDDSFPVSVHVTRGGLDILA
jgi:hypothetical protein